MKYRKTKGYHPNWYKGMVALAEKHNISFDNAAIIWFNPDIEPFLVKQVKAGKSIKRHYHELPEREKKQQELESLACDLNDSEPPKHDEGVWIDRNASQCPYCACFYINAEGEVEEAMNEAGIECSLEMTHCDSSKPCRFFQRIKADCFFCGNTFEEKDYSLVLSPEQLPFSVPPDGFPAHVCSNCIN